MPHVHKLGFTCFPEQRAYSWLLYWYPFPSAYLLLSLFSLPPAGSVSFHSLWKLPALILSKKNKTHLVSSKIIPGHPSTMSFHCKDTCVSSRVTILTSFLWTGPFYPHCPGVIDNITFFPSEKYPRL